MRRIGAKLFLGFLCMAILTVAILWTVQAGVMRNSYLNERVQTIENEVQRAVSIDTIDYQTLEDKLDVSFLTTDQNGNVEYISQGMPMRGMIVNRIGLLDADGEGLRTLEAMSGVRYAIVTQRLGDGKSIYAVFSLTNVEEAAAILRKQLWTVTAALLVFSLVLAATLSRLFSRPILDVTSAARSLAKGELDVKLKIRSRDEIGQLTRALNDLGEQLRINENLQKELIANVSHELRSPLSVIQGYAETVRDVTWPNGEKRTEQLTLIAEEAERLGRIVTDILDYSRLRSGVVKMRLSEVPIKSVLEKAVMRHGLYAAKRNATISLDCPDGVIQFDDGMFLQVVDNLLNNAVNHAAPGTEIDVSVRRDASGYRVSIQNRGEAIPKEELPRIWDRYYRAGEVNEGQRLGTGLGLAIVKSILELHRVDFGVESGPESTAFWFTAKDAGLSEEERNV